MSTNYPNSQDSYSIHQDNVGEKISAADVNNLQDAIKAIESEVGYGSGQPTSSATANTLIKRDANGIDNSNGFAAAGLTGATAASRYVGATASGAPTSGTFAVGDFVIDQTGIVWICTAVGTPGTWTSLVSSLDGGNKIQSGIVIGFTSGSTITFPKAFASGSTPAISVDPSVNNGVYTGVMPLLDAVDSTSFKLFLYSNGNTVDTRPFNIHWRAIGQ